MAQDKGELLASERGPGRNFDVYLNDQHGLDFADGIHSLSLGPSTSRIDFYKTRVIKLLDKDTANPIEERQLSLTIVVPTASLLEFLKNTVSNLAAAEAPLRSAIDQQVNNLHNLAVANRG